MNPIELPATPTEWSAFLAARCDGQLDVVRRTADVIASEPADTATTLSRWNELWLAMLNATNASALLSQVHPDEQVRAEAERAEQAAASAANAVRQDRRLYDVLSALDTSGLDPTTARMLAMTLRDFRRAGVDRDEGTRARLTELADRDTELSQTYERNVNDDVRSISLDPAQLAGLPDDYVAAHPAGPDGRVVVTTDYPDALPFRRFARDAEARRALWTEFDNRGWPANDAILHEILEIRAERARLLGHADWPDYDASIRMIGSGEAIPKFIDSVHPATVDASNRDLALLLARQQDDQPGRNRVSWADIHYYSELVRREQFGVDAQEVRSYFDFTKVRDGLLDVTGRLFGLEYVERPEATTWHPDVTTYDVLAEGQLLGRIYLDLHPRTGKYKHAAHFPLAKGLRDSQLPHSVLVCNLPTGLMDHQDVVTLFHEFGHLIHAVVGGRQEWARFSGVATERDFIEAPSQMLEQWAWETHILQTFATDSAGTPIPGDLVDRMRAADAFGRGFEIQIQLFYAAMSYGLHVDVPADITAYLGELAPRYQPFETLPGTHKHASFGHLADEGYGSAYYTYLWSLVIAKDLFSAFDPADLFAPDTARRYRDVVLARGGSRDAADLVEEFLGRPSNTEAFDRWLAE